MAVRSNVVTVGTTATTLLTGMDTDTNQRDAIVRNGSAVTVYVGGEDVSLVAGFPLDPGQSLVFTDVQVGNLPFGIVAVGSTTVNVLQLGV